MDTNRQCCIKSFWMGFGSILNLSPILNTTPINKNLDPLLSMKEAWNTVGQHLSCSMQQKEVNRVDR